MFGGAVKDYRAVNNKPQIVTQNTLPPSSSNGNLPSNGRRTFGSTSVSSAVTSSNVLKPSAKSVGNSVSPKHAEGPAMQRRKYNSRLERTLTNENSFSEEAALLELSAGGQFETLQDAVPYKGNGFEDDEAWGLSLNSEQQTSKTYYPQRRFDPQRRTSGTQTSSSVPVPWSSSPPEHHAAALSSHGPTNSTKSVADTVTYPSLPSAPSTSTSVSYPNLKRGAAKIDQTEEAPKPSKRRTLPWTAKSNATPEKKASKSDKNGKGLPSGKNGTGGDFTPLPKDRSTTNYPWNVTATAVKNEQKALRQQYKSRVAPPEKADEETATVSKKKKLPAVFLSEEQLKVASMVADEGRSVFFTGSAGTGKSVLMRHIIQKLREKYKKEPDRVAVTASTGLAACNIEGVTLHSFAGIGLGKESATELVKKIKKSIKAKTRWQHTKVLIIDEVSMVDGVLFDKLEEIARILRVNGRPFGGIQLVVTGDFFQLPPVPDRNTPATFSFDANTWNTSIEHTILLTKVFRQRDPVFADMLNEMRVGKLTPKSIETFKKLSRPLQYLDDFSATELFPTRAEVDRANTSRMASLSGTSQTFTAIDTGTITDPEQRNRILANCMAPQVLELKKGAQVMLIKNLEDTLVNGSLGKVVAFMDETTWDYRHDTEEDLDEPDDAEEQDKEAAERRLELKKKMYKNPNAKPGKLWPCVQFTLADGTSRRLLCQPESWKVELPNGEVQAQRQQVPLILAWALSIHKAQGQTLERVKVDMGKIFEKGQAYVALSRATTQSGLQILNFDARKIMAHPKVNEFYSKLVSVDVAAAKSGASSKLSAAKYEQGFIDGEEDEDEEEQLSYMYG